MEHSEFLDFLEELKNGSFPSTSIEEAIAFIIKNEKIALYSISQIIGIETFLEFLKNEVSYELQERVLLPFIKNYPEEVRNFFEKNPDFLKQFKKYKCKISFGGSYSSYGCKWFRKNYFSKTNPLPCPAKNVWGIL